jgi:hypothetical protein
MRRLLWPAAAAAMLAGFAGVGVTSTHASAAETHVNCVAFDSNGNPIPSSVVPNCTATQVLKNQTMSFPSANPCNGAPGMLTLAFTNEIFHETVNGAGDIWLTSTDTGAVSFVPLDPSQPSYFGHTVGWFGTSLNKNNAVFHDTQNSTLTGTDGSTITMHLVDHLSFNANGAVNTFSLNGSSCG